MQFQPTRTATLEPEPDAMPPVTCPLCHTTHSSSAPLDGGDWQCVRCGQKWDAERLGTVARYAASANGAGR
jgi:hypothetical protein